jgi:hypothetical protein
MSYARWLTRPLARRHGFKCDKLAWAAGLAQSTMHLRYMTPRRKCKEYSAICLVLVEWRQKPVACKVRREPYSQSSHSESKHISRLSS